MTVLRVLPYGKPITVPARKKHMERSLPTIEEQIHEIVEWPVIDLYRTARELTLEKDNPIRRQATEAERLLGHVTFEMWARRNRDEAQAA